LESDTKLSYGSTKGSEAVRRAVSEWYSVDKENVLITVGTAEANFLMTLALIKKDSEIVVENPSYMQIHGIAEAIGAKIKKFHLKEENEFRPDLEELKNLVSSKTTLIQITNPNNPTGAKLSSEEMRAICEIAEHAGCHIACDEAFRGLELDGTMTPSPPQIYEKGLATGSLTKLGLHGIRLGWLIADTKTVEKCWGYKDYTTLSHAGISERLATAALEKRNIRRLMETGRRIINDHVSVISKWVSDHSRFFSLVKPKGGAAVFPKYNFEIDSYTFCEKLLSQQQLLVVPGDCFELSKHLRLNSGGYTANLTEGLSRLDKFVAKMAA
jgi:hypothetical protein